MEHKLKLLPPIMPNFLPVENKHKLNMKSEYRIRVCELSDEEAVAYGELMKQAFIQHHKESVKRENGK